MVLLPASSSVGSEWFFKCRSFCWVDVCLVPWCTNRSHWSFSDCSGGWQGILEGQTPMASVWISPSPSVYSGRGGVISINVCVGRSAEGASTHLPFLFCRLSLHLQKLRNVWSLGNYSPWRLGVARTCLCVCVVSCSVVSESSVTPWTVAHQAPLSMGFPTQEYWSGCHCLSRGSSWSRYRAWVSRVSCIGRWIFYH